MAHIGNGLWTAVLLLWMSLPSSGADAEVKAGGIVLTLPGPASDFVDSGDKLRTTFFELLVPSSNRLLIAFIPAQSLIDLNGGKTPGELDAYAIVEMDRQGEYSGCSPELFEQFLKSIDPAKFDPKDIEGEMNTHLKALNLKAMEIGHPEMLGTLFKKANASGFAMLTAYKQGDRSYTMATGLAALRVKQRLVYAFLYRKYESPETVTWLRKNLEAWADGILAKNK